MAGKTLLLLAADSLHAWQWNRGKLSPPQSFRSDPAGFEQFSAYLKLHRCPAYLLADLSEEDYRLEKLPQLRSNDRQGLVQRKIAQIYSSTPFRQAIFQLRRNDGRRDDFVLFTALTNPSLVSIWLDVLLAEQAEVAGIYSMPTISAPLVADNPARHLLLVSRSKYGGLRQTFYNDRLLRFSRLTAMQPGPSWDGNLAREIDQTRHYLNNLNLLPPDLVLDVQVICLARDKHMLEPQLTGSAHLRYSFMELQNPGGRIDSCAEYAESDSTPLFLNLLAAQRNRNNYAQPAHTYFFRISQLRRYLYIASAILTAGSLLWSAANVAESYSQASDTATLAAGLDALERHTEHIQRKIADPRVSVRDMKTAVLVARTLADISPAAEAMLKELSLSLNDFPRIRVTRIAWQTAFPPQAVQSKKSGTDTPNVDISLAGEPDESDGRNPDFIKYLAGFREALIAKGYQVTAPELAAGANSVAGDDKRFFAFSISPGTGP